MKKSFELAIKNISNYGDTDIFPFPVENNIFYDRKDEVMSLLQRIHSKYDEFILKIPPNNQSSLCPVGYTGFRWATQMDPIWNLYLLALVIEISNKIEDARVKIDEGAVFSYRVSIDLNNGKLFSEESQWRTFQEQSISNCKDPKYKFVLICDISDFYSRIYHHRLENALQRVDPGSVIPKRIMDILSKFSGGKSYGLPIGGNSSRILSELVLNTTDKLLKMDGIKFCRYADDYHVFCASVEDAYESLIRLSELLLQNEGLGLQKTKTRIMSVDEFIINSELYNNLDKKTKTESERFLSIHLNYDPYSSSAVEDYENLKSKVAEFDILNILKSEIGGKSKIHKFLMSKLLSAAKFLDVELKNEVALTLINNLVVLAPVYPQVMQFLKAIHADLGLNVRDDIQKKLRDLIVSNHYLILIPLNLHYTVLLMGMKQSDENESLLNQIYYSGKLNETIKKEIILIMTKWSCHHWLTDLKLKYFQLSAWEKRAFIISSYVLGDEGRHWRDHNKNNFNDFEIVVRDWAADKKQTSGFEKLV